FHGSKFVFSPRDTAPSGFSRAKIRLDSSIAKLNGGEPIAPWILHDIRRSTASGLASLGVNLPGSERVLNPVSGSFAGRAGTYERYNVADEMRAGLDRWGRHVETLAGGDTHNVVELSARAS